MASDLLHAGAKRPPPPALDAPPPTRLGRCEEATAWAALPLVAMELVFSYALVDLSVRIEPIALQHQRVVSRRATDAFSLRRWSYVCHDWRDTIEQLITQHQQGSVRLEFPLKHRDELAEKVAPLMRQRSLVADLRVSVYRHIDSPLDPTLSEIDWDALLDRCVNLQRLDLSGMNCFKLHEMEGVINAIARCCPKLRALIFPLPHAWRKPSCGYPFASRVVNLHDSKAMTATLSALETWLSEGGGNALEQLVLPISTDRADTFISLIAKHAPGIQLLDAWKLVYFNDGWGDVRCEEHWHLSLPTWEAFARSCTHLKEFNWGVVPFKDEFMLPFAATKKWQLQELVVNFTVCIWRHFQALTDPVVEAQRLRGSHDGEARTPVTSASLCSLVRALPRLEVLHVNLPSNRAISYDAFDNDFLVAIAKSCPSVKKVIISGGRGYSSDLTLSRISERGLESLGSLVHLEEVALRPVVRLTGAGLKGLVGTAPNAVQLDAKLMVPFLSEEDVPSLIASLQVSSSVTNRPFAVQIAVQEPKNRVVYLPDRSKITKRGREQIKQWRRTLEIVRGGLRFSRMRFQALIDEHSHTLSQITVFTTNWKPRENTVGRLYLRNEIQYNPTQDDALEWILMR